MSQNWGTPKESLKLWVFVLENQLDDSLVYVLNPNKMHFSKCCWAGRSRHGCGNTSGVLGFAEGFHGHFKCILTEVACWDASVKNFWLTTCTLNCAYYKYTQELSYTFLYSHFFSIILIQYTLGHTQTPIATCVSFGHTWVFWVVLHKISENNLWS